MPFDSVDHEYMQEVLKSYGFGPKFINWVKILNKNLTAEVLVNGFKTDKINIEQSVKQGDALSCTILLPIYPVHGPPDNYFIH